MPPKYIAELSPCNALQESNRENSGVEGRRRKREEEEARQELRIRNL
jgi:hypothetical protein